MKETRFIEQNKEKWDEFEQLVKAKKKDPDQLSNLFVEITDDLSFSKTYYPNRLVRAYLNNISQKIYLNLYKNRRQPFEKMKFFFKEDLPFILFHSRKELLLAFLIFSFATLIGVVSCLNDPDYAEVVTSKYYVEMTKENIAKGDPMAVYKDEEAFNMFLRIGWNNLRVAYYTFALGITACVGTIFFMLNNGTMLGGFQFFFFQKGVFVESLLTIWQHGTIEILCIIIAGAAGLVMGKGLIFPGTYPRLQSLQMSAKRGLKIMLSITPLIVIAALIEAYITRLTEAPLLFRLFIILASLAVMIGYFVYYPWAKSKSGFHASLKHEKPKALPKVDLSLNKIKTTGEVFAESFGLYKKFLPRFFFFGLLWAVVFGVLHVVYMEEELFIWDYNDFLDILADILEYMFLFFFSFFKYNTKPLISVANILMIGGLFALGGSVIRNAVGKETKALHWLKFYLISVVFAAILNMVFLMDSNWMYLLFVVLQPFILFPMAAIITDDKPIGKAIGDSLGYLFSGFFRVLLLWLMTVVIFILFMLISNTSLASIVVDFVQSNFLMEADVMSKFSAFTSAFLSILTFNMVFPLFFIAFGLQYHSLKEAKEANHLLERIKNFGTL